MPTRTEPTPQPPIRLTFDGHGFNDAGDPYRRRFATLAPYYTHPDRESGETDALCELVVRAVNSHAALVEALEYINSATEGIEAPIDPDEYVEITITGQGLLDLRAALAAAKVKP